MLTENDVRTIIAEAVPTIDAAALARDAEFAKNDIDSLDFSAILLALQEQHGLTVPDDDLQQVNSIEKILAYAARRAG
jgi:acyl carrier protein